MLVIKEMLVVLCVALVILLAAAYTPLFQGLSRALGAGQAAEIPTPQAPSPTPLAGTARLCASGELENQAYGYACDGDVLKFKVCDSGAERDREVYCTKVSIEEFVGFCNPAAQTTGGVRAECDLKPAALAAAPTPTFTLPSPSPVPTPLLPPKLPLGELKLSGCGDGACDPGEKCGSCPQDCGCQNDSFCASDGTCTLRESCGDGACTAKENSDGNCCVDCGCSSDGVCNAFTGACTAPVKISDRDLNDTLSSTFKRYGMPAEALVEVRDSYYEDYAVKEIVFNCDMYGEYDFPCRIVLVVDGEGDIIAEYHTA
jgi:hypothetical protein